MAANAFTLLMQILWQSSQAGNNGNAAAAVPVSPAAVPEVPAAIPVSPAVVPAVPSAAVPAPANDYTRMGEMHLFRAGSVQGARRPEDDLVQARQYFELAKETDINAKFWLARTNQMQWEDPSNIYEDSTVRNSRSEGFKVYQALAEQGHPEACSELGHMYEHNLVADLTLNEGQRLKLAQHYYKKAYDLGSIMGTCRLMHFYKKHFVRLQQETNPNDTSAFIDSAGSKITPQFIFHELSNTLATVEANPYQFQMIPHSHPFSPRPHLVVAVAECFQDNFGVNPRLDETGRRSTAEPLLNHAKYEFAKEHPAIEIGLFKTFLLYARTSSDLQIKKLDFLRAIEAAKRGRKKIYEQGIYGREAIYQVFHLATISTSIQFGFETLATLQHAVELQSYVNELYLNPQGAIIEYATYYLESYLDEAANGGHPEALQAAVTYYSNAAINLPIQMDAALRQKLKLQFLRKAYQFLKLAEYKDVQVEGVDHKLFQENLQIDLEVEAAVYRCLESALRQECKELFETFCTIRKQEIDNLDRNPAQDVKDRKELCQTVSASSVKKQEIFDKLKIIFTHFLKDKGIRDKIRAYYISVRNWSHDGAIRLYFAQHPNISDIMPPYLRQDFCFEVVLGRMFKQKLEHEYGFQAFLMGQNPRLGAASAILSSFKQSKLFDRRLLALVNSYYTPGFTFKDAAVEDVTVEKQQKPQGSKKP